MPQIGLHAEQGPPGDPAGGFARLHLAGRRAGAIGADAPPPLPAVDPYAAAIAEVSQHFGLPMAWIKAVMRAESAGDPHAISPAGAMG